MPATSTNPYIVTTTQGDVREAEIRIGGRLTAIMDGSAPASVDSERIARRALAEVESRKTRRACATLKEAQEAAYLYVSRNKSVEPWNFAALTHQCYALPAEGGSIGPLRDGSVIEVEPVAWSKLAELAGCWESWMHAGTKTTAELYAEIIDAFNAAQEVPAEARAACQGGCGREVPAGRGRCADCEDVALERGED